MKRLGPAILILLFAMTACLPCGAVCAGARMPAGHACCRGMSQGDQVTCCAPQPSSQSAISQANQAVQAAAMPAAVQGTIAAHALLSVHELPLPAPPDSTHAPPLVLRT